MLISRELDLYVTKKNSGEYVHNFNHNWPEIETQEPMKSLVKRIYLLAKHGQNFTAQLEQYYKARSQAILSDTTASNTAKDEAVIEMKKSIASRLIKFFSEFEFEPNYRFVNTLSIKAHQSYEQATQYCARYFALAGNDYATALNDRMTSQEWKSIIVDINQLPASSTKINSRLKIYYGSQGTGKTKLGMSETSNLVMVCHSSMLPSDLLRDFDFENGKPTFKHTALRTAIEEGKRIVLDEINLLPLESLRFLQSILDGKAEFSYGDETIKIADGFEIIGTMNLYVNGQCYGLPEPLIDRAYDLREFKLKPEDLVAAF